MNQADSIAIKAEHRRPAILKIYLELAKPERTLANLITAAAGFLLASRWHINFGLLVSMLAGTSLVIASACVANNLIDKDIDKKMSRTNKRSLVSGEVSTRAAVAYLLALGVAGFLILGFFVNGLVVWLGAVGFADYVFLYTLSKRRTVYSTWIGTISGSVPITAGYCAVADKFDFVALLLFLAMVFWQMAHFYAIAIYRQSDYAKGGIPVFPIKKGIHITKVQIMVFIMGFLAAALFLGIQIKTGLIYFVVVTVVAAYWFTVGLRTFKSVSNELWAKKMFFISLKSLLIFAACVALGSIMP